jgi:hypothetical protein
MRTTLDLPDPLFRSLKTRAAMDGTTLKDLVVRFVQRGLTQPQADLPTAPIVRGKFPVILDTKARNLVQPFPAELLTNAGLYALMDAEDEAKVVSR